MKPDNRLVNIELPTLNSQLPINNRKTTSKLEVDRWMSGVFRPASYKLHLIRRILLAGFLSGIFLQANGNAEQAVPINSPLHGKNRICFLVQAGKAVTKGEALAVFNPEEKILALHAADAAVQEAENKIRGIENELAALAGGQDTKRKPLEAVQQEAARALERYLQVDQPLAEKRLQQAVQDADWALRKEQEQCDGRDDLLKQGAIRKNEWEEAGLKVQRAKLAAETAHANLDAHLKYEKGPQTDRLTEACHQAEAALKALQAAFESSKTTLDASLATAKSQCAAVQASRAHQQEQLTQTAVLAPSDGIFRPATESGSETKLATGSEVSEGQLLGTIVPK